MLFAFVWGQSGLRDPCEGFVRFLTVLFLGEEAR